MSEVRLILGDCLDVLPTLSGIDAVVTDPPFGMNWNTDSTRFTGGKGSHHKRSERIIDDDKPFDPLPWLAFSRVALWGSNHYAERLPRGTTLVWSKKSPAKWGKFLSDCEVGWMSGGHGVYAFLHVWDGCARAGHENGKHLHPTQKPIALMKWVLDRLKVPEGATVLDPYMGSGSTGIACIETGRNFIGIEKSPEYFAIAQKRIAEARNAAPLFEKV